MAISNSIDYIVTRDDIITEALEQLGVLAEDESPSSGQLTSCSRTLNMMVKAWQGEGANLFAQQQCYLLLEKDKHEYTLSSTGDNFTTSYTKTQLSVAGVATDSTITVDSDDDISDVDYIGIELDDGTMQWTTVNGAPAANVVTLTTALTGAAAIDNYVFNYTTKANRPMKVLAAQALSTNDAETSVSIINKSEYLNLSNKTTDGIVSQKSYDPQISSPTLRVYNEVDDVTDVLVLTCQRTLSDFDAAGDNPDFPQEWYLALAFNLAVLLAPKYGIDKNDFERIAMIAMGTKEIAMGFDVDESLIFSAE